MLRSVVAVTLVLTVSACRKEIAKPDAGTTSGPLRSQSKVPPPADGPCAVDAECYPSLEPCSCACLPALLKQPAREPTPNTTYATMCTGGPSGNGSPPGNCGVASPCMNRSAFCDATTKKCALRRVDPDAGPSAP